MGNGPINVLTDPDFQQLPLPEKHKVLLATDESYRGLPPSEQGKALDHIHYDPQYGPKNEKVAGVGNRLADTIQTQTEGGARKLLSNFMLPESISDVTSGEYGKRITKPGRLSDIIEPYKEAGKRSPVGYVPLIGPPSVAASEDLRQGKYGEMGADLATGVAQLSPMAHEGVGSAVKGAVSKTLRTPTGELRTPVRLASQIGGAAAGHEVAGPGIGTYLGYKEGPSLAESIIPDRPKPKLTPFKETADNPWTPLANQVEHQGVYPSADEWYNLRGEELMKRGKEQGALDRAFTSEGKAVPIKNSPFATQHEAQASFDRGEAGPHNKLSESPEPARRQRLADDIEKGTVTRLPEGGEKGRGPLTPEQVPGKPNLRRLAKGGDSRAGAELQRRGEKVIYTPEGGYAPLKSKSTLSEIMESNAPKKRGPKPKVKPNDND